MRGSGKTTRQLKEAPPRAYFVWCNSKTYYPKKLAQSLGRDDITIVPPDFINQIFCSNHFVVADHAAELTLSQRALLKLNNKRFKDV